MDSDIVETRLDLSTSDVSFSCDLGDQWCSTYTHEAEDRILFLPGTKLEEPEIDCCDKLNGVASDQVTKIIADIKEWSLNFQQDWWTTHAQQLTRKLELDGIEIICEGWNRQCLDLVDYDNDNKAVIEMHDCNAQTK